MLLLQRILHAGAGEGVWGARGRERESVRECVCPYVPDLEEFVFTRLTDTDVFVFVYESERVSVWDTRCLFV